MNVENGDSDGYETRARRGDRRRSAPTTRTFAALKARFDPNNVFRLNQNVAPGEIQ
ncbi:MAG: BBE domain-containing protein [Planctomycetes bacterium]|nr:BBE domain-containing protein [Planctomycetota bacterium]